MIRMPKAAGDAAEEKKRVDEENKLAKMVTVQNIFAFFVVLSLIRAAPWALEHLQRK
uniref:Uncharacterized protein n=1 Tax=Arion vulgaris TaxID=1028688 RepID=A0A0B6YAM3_9EUPU